MFDKIKSGLKFVGDKLWSGACWVGRWMKRHPIFTAVMLAAPVLAYFELLVAYTILEGGAMIIWGWWDTTLLLWFLACCGEAVYLLGYWIGEKIENYLANRKANKENK